MLSKIGDDFCAHVSSLPHEVRPACALLVGDFAGLEIIQARIGTMLRERVGVNIIALPDAHVAAAKGAIVSVMHSTYSIQRSTFA